MEEEENKSNLKKLLGFIFFLIVVFLLIFYWFVPFRETEFFVKSPSHSNFSLDNHSIDMQFYSNMRYLTSEISYRIENCTLQKQDDMQRAFDIIENTTTLFFYPVEQKEDISVTCDSKSEIRAGLFIAGEGGPTNITRTENFNIITHGSILLIRDSQCNEPNVAIHELLHALGFDHSSNPNNIMYGVSKCKQTISQDIINLIDELYSYPSYPDLSFENVSAFMHGRFLDLNISIRNNGLGNSKTSKVEIYGDDELIEEFDLNPIKFGEGRLMKLWNSLILKRDFDQLSIFINSSFEELDKENNKIILEIKK